MKEICFGPFVSKTHGPARDLEQFAPAGLAIEFSTPSGGYTMHLHHNDDSDPTSLRWNSGIGRFYVHHSDLSREVGYSLMFRRMVKGQMLLPLHDVLLPLYRKFPFQTPLTELLTEIRGHYGNPYKFDVHDPNLLNEKASALGFRSNMIFNYGRKIHVDLEWAPLVDRDKPSPLSVPLLHVEFVPGPGRTLGPGKWSSKLRSGRDHLGLYMQPALKKLGNPPIKLFSPEGIEKLMAQFEWTPASLLPRAELDEARRTYIAARPELWQDVTALAKGLIAEGLYSKTTDLSTLKRRLKTLLSATQ